MFEDKNLTEHFKLSELTSTSHPEFQDKNRELTEEQINKLKAVAELLERVRYLLDTPLTVLSGYRCPELNKAIGSTDRSQHLLCEAADFMPGQQDLGSAFRALWKEVKNGGPDVGQLIHETAQRNYGPTSWLHISLGQPYREANKCQQILRYENGIYTILA